MILFTLFLMVQSGAPSQNLLWEYRLTNLRDYSSRQQWVEAKRTLDQLKVQDFERYLREELPVSRALAAERERKWHTAIEAYERNSRDGFALLNMALAESAIAIGDHERAQSVLLDIKELELPSVEAREKRRFLLAEMMLINNKPVRAAQMFTWLTRKAKKYQFILPSYTHLIMIADKGGDRLRARLLSEKLQRTWPGSDEALQSAYYQWEHESEQYLNKFARRIGLVGYRNRDYELSDAFFSRVIEQKSKKQWHQALYLMCLTHLKKENPQKAADAFETNYKRFQGSKYEGLAAFQTARSLFMLGKDADVLLWVNQTVRDLEPQKWRWETEKLRILALRRSGRVQEFDALRAFYQQEKAPDWLWTFYHQNGIAQAIVQQKPQRASSHLNEISRRHLDIHRKLELMFWEAVIAQRMGQLEQAINLWTMLVGRYPNHYYGIAARHMLNALPAGEARLEPDVKTDAVAPLRADVIDFSISYKSLHRDHSAAALARIGRFDWAAWTLNWKQDRQWISRSNFLILKAKWFASAGIPHETIRLSAALKQLFPKQTPVESLPMYLQQLLYPLGYYTSVLREAGFSKVDPLLLQAIMREETHFNASAKSAASARGLMQFIPETARRVSLRRFPDSPVSDLSDLYIPDVSISLGAAFLAQLQESFGYMSLYSIAAYNAGEGAVEKWKSMAMTPDNPDPFVYDPLLFIFDVTYSETKRYCQKVLASYFQYRRIYQQEESFPQGFQTRLGQEKDR